MRFWISWFQPTKDHRPLTFPPNEAIAGWWCSGYNSVDHATICAAVDAESEDDAHEAIKKDWPEATGWRFCEQVESEFRPNDRFPPSPWMVPRLARNDKPSTQTA